MAANHQPLPILTHRYFIAHLTHFDGLVKLVSFCSSHIDVHSPIGIYHNPFAVRADVVIPANLILLPEALQELVLTVVVFIDIGSHVKCAYNQCIA